MEVDTGLSDPAGRSSAFSEPFLAPLGVVFGRRRCYRNVVTPHGSIFSGRALLWSLGGVVFFVGGGRRNYGVGFKQYREKKQCTGCMLVTTESVGGKQTWETQKETKRREYRTRTVGDVSVDRVPNFCCHQPRFHCAKQARQ